MSKQKESDCHRQYLYVRNSKLVVVGAGGGGGRAKGTYPCFRDRNDRPNKRNKRGIENT